MYILITIFLFAGSGCERDSITSTDPPPPPPPPPPIVNTPPRAYAGQDIWTVVTDGRAALKGSFVDAENNVDRYLWKQVSGPSSGTIEYPGAVETKVSNLEKGSYEFEFTVTDKEGLSGKDTVAVFVREPAAPGNGEVIVKDLEWSCPMGCWLDIQCFSCLVPGNQPFKVYLRVDNSNQWIEAMPEANWTDTDKYVYGISNNNLWIYSNYGDDGKVDVKMTY